MSVARFAPVRPNEGFDAPAVHGGIPSLMVIQSQCNSVMLINPTGITFNTPPPGVLIEPRAVRDGNQVIRITTPDSPRRFTLEARRGSTVEAAIEIYTLTYTEILVDVHAVSDAANHHTNRALAEASRILDQANQILRPQAAINLRLNSATRFSAAGNLGYPIEDAATGAFHGQLPRENYHVFFVWEIDRTRRRRVRGRVMSEDTEGLTIQSDWTLLEDRLSTSPGQIIAHETGHWLGLHHDPHRSNLMHSTVPSGVHITATQACAMSEFAARRPGLPPLPPAFFSQASPAPRVAAAAAVSRR